MEVSRSIWNAASSENVSAPVPKVKYVFRLCSAPSVRADSSMPRVMKAEAPRTAISPPSRVTDDRLVMLPLALPWSHRRKTASTTSSRPPAPMRSTECCVVWPVTASVAFVTRSVAVPAPMLLTTRFVTAVVTATVSPATTTV